MFLEKCHKAHGCRAWWEWHLATHWDQLRQPLKPLCSGIAINALHYLISSPSLLSPHHPLSPSLPDRCTHSSFTLGSRLPWDPYQCPISASEPPESHLSSQAQPSSSFQTNPSQKAFSLP